MEKIRISNVYLDLVLMLALVIMLPLALLASLYYPNVHLEQGLAHRIFYFHVPVAWVALYGPVLSSITSIVYLVSRKAKWDAISFSFNQLSLLFAVGVLFSGPIWAKSAWGVPWDWTDARLQSFFILFLSLLAYFIIRNLITDIEKKPVYSSFLSILCAANAVITWGAIRWVENPGNHPSSLWSEKGGMARDMAQSFWLGVLAYHLLFLALFAISYRVEKSRQVMRQIKDIS